MRWDGILLSFFKYIRLGTLRTVRKYCYKGTSSHLQNVFVNMYIHTLLDLKYRPRVSALKE